MILSFLLSTKRYHEVRGREVWKSMSAACGRKRSWQSLKERFQKRIIPRLPHHHLTDREEALIREGEQWCRQGNTPPRNTTSQQQRHLGGRGGKKERHPALNLDARESPSAATESDDISCSGSDTSTDNQGSEDADRKRGNRNKNKKKCYSTRQNSRRNRLEYFNSGHNSTTSADQTLNASTSNTKTDSSKNRNQKEPLKETGVSRRSKKHNRNRISSVVATDNFVGRKRRLLHHRLSNVGLYKASPAIWESPKRQTRSSMRIS